ncbi:aminotransferase class V-fold PLP-dependent enzyme [Pseudooceanicola aestuarii]|uniref:aminotransferase class V-fold PLP-dependent enzyme n=1 Tax=Pseudooceanicola aestuarii TaxID=2697319 RepID=UPI0013D71D19|nr:aminotransferase class V-fold PLP-dependent enzyme [Pseudooceanicola aestuarii]
MVTPPTPAFFDTFEAELAAAGPEALHAGEIGRGMTIDGPFGPVPMLYADFVASGRAFEQLEDRMRTILPWYANSHTEASVCGATMTSLRRAARSYIARQLGAGADHAVIFAGSGATAGINRLPHLLGFAAARAAGRRVIVLVGPYEHHSNLLPWRESGAEVQEIPECPTGGPCPDALRAALDVAGPDALVLGAFSAASNVTGALTDVAAITAILKQAGALSFWDYAGGGPYLPIAMTPAPGVEIDALALSPHKFPGGPGASGLLAIRRDAVQGARPATPGGGTVSFVSPWGHDYAANVEQREEAGTPNVLGDLRAALALAMKAALGAAWIADRNADLLARAETALAAAPGIAALPTPPGARLPILSFRVADGAGGYHHHQLATRLLSDLFGVQARGGCACAGPYVHRLFGIDATESEALRQRLHAGEEMAKPGFVRLNLSYLLTDAEADHVLRAIRALPAALAEHGARYRADPARAVFAAA